jgi:trk system potassium uptake protein TrkA
MKVIVVGCGQLGSALAYQMVQLGHQVTVIDQDAAAFDNLPADFHGRTIEGDVLTRNVLRRAEIQHADALAAVTRSDSLNALVAYVARTEYHVSRVMARNYDPRQHLLQEAFGIPVVGSATWGVRRIIRLLSDAPLRPVFLDGNANLAIYQLEAPEAWRGRSLQELLQGHPCQVLAMTRGGQPIQNWDSQPLEVGDVIYLSADPEVVEALQRQLGAQQEPSA